MRTPRRRGGLGGGGAFLGRGGSDFQVKVGQMAGGAGSGCRRPLLSVHPELVEGGADGRGRRLSLAALGSSFNAVQDERKGGRSG